MHVKPFAALRPRPDLADKVAAVPYDVVTAAEAAALAARNPYSFLHVTRAEIDLPSGADPHGEAVYLRSAENFARFVRQGVLLRESKPMIYLYRQIMGQHSQRGIVACCSVDEYRRGVIRKHENTRRDKEDDRTRHIRALRANSGPVFIAYRDRSAIDAIARETEATAPLYDFTASDGVQHTIWSCPAADCVVSEFRRVPVAYIADGHHRAAAAARYADEERAAGRAGDDAESEWFLAVLFPSSQLQILPYNRVVRDLNGIPPARFIETVAQRVKVRSDAKPEPDRSGHASMYFQKRWYGLSWDPPAEPDPVAALDVSVLQDRLLHPVLGIADPRTDKRIEFVGGIRGTRELERMVDAQGHAVAFSMYPTTLDQLMAVADAGRLMPPKSTWFEPKLRSGLLIHTL